MSRIAVDSREFSLAAQHPLTESFPVAQAIVMACVSKALFESEKNDLTRAIKEAKETGDRVKVKELMNVLKVLTLQVQRSSHASSRRLVVEAESDSSVMEPSSQRFFIEDDGESSRRFVHCFSTAVDAQKEFFSVLFMQLIAANCMPSVKPILEAEGAADDDVVHVDISFFQRVIGTEWESISSFDEGVVALPFNQALPPHLNTLLANDLPGLLLGLIFLNQPWEAGDVIYLQEKNRNVFLRIYDLKESPGLPNTPDLLCFLNNGMMQNGERSELLSVLSNNRQFRKNIALSFLGMVLIPYSFVSTFSQKTEGVEFYRKMEEFVDRVSGSPHLYDCISIVEFSDLDAYFSKYFSCLSQFFSVLNIEKTRNDFLDQYLHVVFLLFEKKLESECRALLEMVCEAVKKFGVSLLPNEVSAAFTLIEVLHEIPRTVNLADLDWMRLAQIERQLTRLHELFEGWSAVSSSRIFSVSECERFSHFLFSLKNLLSLTLLLYQKLKRREGSDDSVVYLGETLSTVTERHEALSLQPFHQFLLSWTERGVFLDKDCLERKVMMGIFSFAKTAALSSPLFNRIEEELNAAASPGMLFHKLFLMLRMPEFVSIRSAINTALENFISFLWSAFFLKNKWAEDLEVPSSTDMCFLEAFEPLTAEAISHCMMMLSDFHQNNFAERFLFAQFRQQNHFLSRLPVGNPYLRQLQRLHEKESSGFSVLDTSDVTLDAVRMFELGGLLVMGDKRSTVSSAVITVTSAVSNGAVNAVSLVANTALSSTSGLTQGAQSVLSTVADTVISSGTLHALSSVAGTALSSTTGLTHWGMRLFGRAVEEVPAAAAIESSKVTPA